MQKCCVTDCNKIAYIAHEKFPGIYVCDYHSELFDHIPKKDTTERLLEQRGSIYGDIRDNMNCAHELMKVLDLFMNKSHAFDNFNMYDYRGHQGCLVMICHKLARVVTGATIHADNYDDIGGYAKLARDIAVKATEKKDNDSNDKAMPRNEHKEAGKIGTEYPRNPTVPPHGGYSE